MTEGRAKTVIVASVGAAALLSSLESLAQARRPPLTVGVGAVVAGVLLLAIAEVAPALGGGLGLLLLVGALLRNGQQAVQTVTDSLD